MKDKKKIGRREFLKVAGTGAAVTTAALYGCKPRSAGSASEADGARQGQMTYRTNPKTGERVSLLGYGCMRWPTVSGSDDIDQEMVNALVDHAIAHGVNYFDTSPAYCRGHSEHATGVALSRHPRDKYFIATKLSNFAPSTWSREASMAMYRNSFRELQVDYIDYLLLHGVGMGSGMEEFEDIVVRANPDGSIVRIRDVARVSLEASSYSTESGLNGKNAAILAIYMLPGANALEVATNVKEAMKEISQNFPEGLEYKFPFDATEYISQSIHEVYKTLFEALFLVVLVVFLSLQNWRAALIPTIAVPISLIGTFGFMLIMGFSLNMLTLLGLILAIGI